MRRRKGPVCQTRAVICFPACFPSSLSPPPSQENINSIRSSLRKLRSVRHCLSTPSPSTSPSSFLPFFHCNEIIPFQLLYNNLLHYIFRNFLFLQRFNHLRRSKMLTANKVKCFELTARSENLTNSSSYSQSQKRLERCPEVFAQR